MIDKELLKELGFVKGTNFNCETWTNDGEFYVRYDKNIKCESINEVSGYASLSEFITKYVENAEHMAYCSGAGIDPYRQ